MEFRQKYFWFETKARIVSNGVEFYSKTFNKSNEYFASFEQLKGKVERQEFFGIYFPKALKIVLLVGGFPLLLLISKLIENDNWYIASLIIVPLTITIAYYAIESKNRNYYIIYGAERGIYFFLNLPNERTVKEFVDLIFEKRTEFLISTYASIDRDRSREDNLSRIMWLKDNGVISPEKYLNLKSDLERVLYGANPIGFQARDRNSD